jgi:cytochrome c1
MRRLILALAALILVALFVIWSYGVPRGDYEKGVAAAAAASGPPAPPLPREEWTFEGPFGTYDRAAVQRGLKVYVEVCQNCHTLNLVRYGDLGPDGPAGGIGYTDEDAKAIAAASPKKYADTDDSGQPVEREGRLTDTPLPVNYDNIKQAKATFSGAVPPDLSVIIRARDGGADYVLGLLSGFHDNAPAGFDVAAGQYYNDFFPGHRIAMPPPPLADKPAEAEQQRRDVVNFLAWATDPTMEERKRTGVKVLIFLVVLTGLLLFAKRKIWADVH